MQGNITFTGMQAATTLEGLKFQKRDSSASSMHHGSLGRSPLTLQGASGFVAPGCSFDSSCWPQTMMNQCGYPYGYQHVQCYPQQVKAFTGQSPSAVDGCSSKQTTDDTATWYSQQQTADSAAALAAAAGMGWPIQMLQQQSTTQNPDELVRNMLWDDNRSEQQSKPLQQSKQLRRSGGSCSSAQAAVSSASPAPSSTTYGTAAAFAAAMQNAQMQAATSHSSGGMLSPAAYVHNAQQMLMQQSHHMQAMQQQPQQQVLLGLGAQQQAAIQLPAQHQQCQLNSRGGMAAVVSSTPVSNAAAATTHQALHGSLHHQQHDQQRPCTPRAMRAALGDRAFFSMRSIMIKQQETFVSQLFELHRLVHVQGTLQSEALHEHHKLTNMYEQDALASLQRSQEHSRSVQAADADRPSAARQQQRSPPLLAGQRGVDTDDRGAAAAALLPIHMALMANLPSTVRSAVSQPRYGDYAVLNPKTYYVKQAHAPGAIRPTPMRYVGRASGKGGSSGTVKSAGAAASAGEDTVQVAEQQDSPAVQSKQQQQTGRQGSPQHSRVSIHLHSGKRPVATPSAMAATAGSTPGRGKPPLSGAPKASAAQQQQQQAMPPPRPLLPQQAAQHAAAAQQQQHKVLQQQQQQEAATAAVRDAAAGLSATAGLNVFRPMPQIDPQFASKFLAGGAGNAAAASALAAPKFDPHAYWMSKHYGSSAAQQQQQQQHSSSHAGDDTPNAAAAAAAAMAAGLMGGAMNAAAAAAAYSAELSDAGLIDPAAAAATMTGSNAQTLSGNTQQRQQQQYAMAAASGLAGLAAAAAAAASAGGIDPAAAAAAPRSVVHWWQDAEATFGEIGLIDPNAKSQSRAEGGSQGARDRKRDFPQQYSLQQLPHKKRVKHAAAAASAGADCYNPYASAPGGYYGYGGYEPAEQDVAAWDGGQDGAFKPLARPSPSKERSKVRSNRMGSSRKCDSSVCSDNSASSMDNPSYIAAAAAAALGEAGPDADGVSLLLHIGQQAAQQGAARNRNFGVMPAGQRKVGTGSGRGSASGEQKSSSYAASAVGGSGHSTAKSAAGILLSLSASQSDAH